jgi:hypothetical protein
MVAMIHDHDGVLLTRDLPEHGLKAGDIGTIVSIHQEGAGFEVEFVTFNGTTVAVVTLAAKDVRPIGPREIAHARVIA